MLADDELMRGNFVMFFDRHKIGHKAIVDQVLRHSCLLMYTTVDAGEYGQEVIVNYEDIHGIPITADILEKNGLPKRDCPALPDLLTYGFGIYEIEQYPNNREKGEWEISITVEYEGTDLRTVKYVHELQQFMKVNETDYKITTV